MLIGSKSANTVLDVVKIGITQVTRDLGLPLEAHYKTKGCEVLVKAADMSKKIDSMRIIFPVKRGVKRDHVREAISAVSGGGEVYMSNGTCALTIPSRLRSTVTQILSQLAERDTERGDGVSRGVFADEVEVDSEQSGV